MIFLTTMFLLLYLEVLCLFVPAVGLPIAGAILLALVVWVKWPELKRMKWRAV